MSEAANTRDMIDLNAEQTKGSDEPKAESKIPQAELERLTDELISAFKTVFDPEIPVDIYELGLIYDIEGDASGLAVIQMTLTAPGCGMGQVLKTDVEEKIRRLRGVSVTNVELVFDPPWSIERMSEEARLELGFE